MAGLRRWQANRSFSKSLVRACPGPCGKRAKPWHADSSAAPRSAAHGNCLASLARGKSLSSTLTLSRLGEGKDKPPDHPGRQTVQSTTSPTTTVTRFYTCQTPDCDAYGMRHSRDRCLSVLLGTPKIRHFNATVFCAPLACRWTRWACSHHSQPPVYARAQSGSVA